jgi:hypothetical protein
LGQINLGELHGVSFKSELRSISALEWQLLEYFPTPEAISWNNLQAVKLGEVAPVHEPVKFTLVLLRSPFLLFTIANGSINRGIP